MFVPNDKNPTDDEIILRVRYAGPYNWPIKISIILLSSVFILGAYDVLLPKEQYTRIFLCAVTAIILLVFALEFILTKHILFCRDRVVKEWYLFGTRSIPYSRARLEHASFLNQTNQLRKGKGYSIKEIGTSGSVTFLQVPVYYNANLATRETDRKVDAVLSYLVGIEGNSAVNEKVRVFQRSTLPKEVLSC